VYRTDDALGVEDDGEDEQDAADGRVIHAQLDGAVVEGGRNGGERDDGHRGPRGLRAGELHDADQQQADEQDVNPQRDAVVDESVDDAAGGDDSRVDTAGDGGDAGDVDGREERQAAHGGVGTVVSGGLL